MSKSIDKCPCGKESFLFGVCSSDCASRYLDNPPNLIFTKIDATGKIEASGGSGGNDGSSVKSIDKQWEVEFNTWYVEENEESGEEYISANPKEVKQFISTLLKAEREKNKFQTTKIKLIVAEVISKLKDLRYEE